MHSDRFITLAYLDNVFGSVRLILHLTFLYLRGPVAFSDAKLTQIVLYRFILE